MKRIFVLVLLSAVIVVAASFGWEEKTDSMQSGYLRIHIRANSDGEADQTVKYVVRDRIIEFLTPTVAECGEKSQAIDAVKRLLGEISAVATETLRGNGFTYTAKAYLRQEEFPTRVYEDVTLPAGVYDALIVELGAAAGDNWWCVVYPPLCFTGSNVRIVYKSKIEEILRQWFK